MVKPDSISGAEDIATASSRLACPQGQGIQQRRVSGQPETSSGGAHTEDGGQQRCNDQSHASGIGGHISEPDAAYRRSDSDSQKDDRRGAYENGVDIMEYRFSRLEKELGAQGYALRLALSKWESPCN